MKKLQVVAVASAALRRQSSRRDCRGGSDQLCEPADLRAAIAVNGGLITSTVLSLLVVPVVFTYLDDTEHFIGRIVRKLRRKPHAATGAGEPASAAAHDPAGRPV